VYKSQCRREFLTPLRALLILASFMSAISQHKWPHARMWTGDKFNVATLVIYCLWFCYLLVSQTTETISRSLPVHNTGKWAAASNYAVRNSKMSATVLLSAMVRHIVYYINHKRESPTTQRDIQEVQDLHRNPASRKGRRRGTQCSGDINTRTWPSRLGSLKWDSKVWLRVLRDSGQWVITLRIVDPSSRQRGRHTKARQHISDSNFPIGSNVWSQVPQGSPLLDILTPSVVK
jgi:hypothetical protein